MKRDPLRAALTMMKRSPGRYYCISTKSRTGKWKDHFFKRSELGKVPAFIKHRKSSDIYMCPQGFSKPRRHKDCAEAPYLAFADLDECKINEIPIKPTVLIESSPGRYVGYWYTDGPVPEELNRRLTYFVGADPSGWDWSQVLRFPGTQNHKYPRKPVVKYLWTDGPRYEVARLEKMVPEVENDDGRQQGGEAQEIYDEYEEDIPRRVRRELINPKVQHGKRSEVLWWLISELVEVGMKKDEIFTLLWDNEWNKHAERRGGERQLEREIDKALGNHVGGSKKLKSKKNKGKEPKSTFFNVLSMDKVKQEQHQWLVEDMIALGEVTLFEATPALGNPTSSCG